MTKTQEFVTVVLLEYAIIALQLSNGKKWIWAARQTSYVISCQMKTLQYLSGSKLDTMLSYGRRLEIGITFFKYKDGNHLQLGSKDQKFFSWQDMQFESSRVGHQNDQDPFLFLLALVDGI